MFQVYTVQFVYFFLFFFWWGACLLRVMLKTSAAGICNQRSKNLPNAEVLQIKRIFISLNAFLDFKNFISASARWIFGRYLPKKRKFDDRTVQELGSTSCRAVFTTASISLIFFLKQNECLVCVCCLSFAAVFNFYGLKQKLPP